MLSTKYESKMDMGKVLLVQMSFGILLYEFIPFELAIDTLYLKGFKY